jgi:hypothetical protein
MLSYRLWLISSLIGEQGPAVVRVLSRFRERRSRFDNHDYIEKSTE